VKILFIALLFLLFFSLSGDEYSFDAEEFEKSPYELICSFKVQPEFMLLKKSSKLYTLSYLNKKQETSLDSYSGSLQVRGSYELSKFKLYADFKNLFQYTTNNETKNSFFINESYLNIDFTKSLSVRIGRQSVKWGKGYVWNPVSFGSRQKDISDIDAGLEGFWMLKLDYIKTFSGFIQNFSLSSLTIPVISKINSDFQKRDTDNINSILNAYFLVFNFDFGLYLFMKDENLHKSGVDFAKNILENWEIHGEYVFEKNEKSFHSYLFGTRMLFPTDTTVIFEYLHNDSGVDGGQLERFFDTIDNAISGDKTSLEETKKFQSEHLISQFAMK